MNFGLKAFFAVITACAILVVLAIKAGYLVTLGLVCCLAMFYWSLRSMRRGWMIVPRVLVGAFSLVTIWFLAVDWSWHIWECPRCRSTREIYEYHVLGFTVSGEVWEERSIFDRAFEDMGFGCRHPSWDDFHKHRLWGLLICAQPCWNGTFGFLGEDDRYTESIAMRLREIGQTRPDFAEKVVNQVVKQHDTLFFWDALMTDLLVEPMLAQPESEEAIQWLRGSTNEIPRHIGKLDLEQSFDLVQELYDAGASEIFVVDPEVETLVIGHPYTLQNEVDAGVVGQMYQDNKYGKVCRKLVIKLPEETARRKHIMTVADSKEKFRANHPTEDGGQQYLEVNID